MCHNLEMDEKLKMPLWWYGLCALVPVGGLASSMMIQDDAASVCTVALVTGWCSNDIWKCVKTTTPKWDFWTA